MKKKRESKGKLEEDFALFTLLSQTRDTLTKARQWELRPVGINMIQAAVLYMVKSTGGTTTPAEISRWLFREPNTVFVVVNRMVAQGLLEKTKDLDNRHLARVSLTEKGKTALQKSRARRQKISRIMSCLSEEERIHLKAMLQKVRDHGLEELGIDMPLPYP